jgi:hypothetical protein
MSLLRRKLTEIKNVKSEELTLREADISRNLNFMLSIAGVLLKNQSLVDTMPCEFEKNTQEVLSKVTGLMNRSFGSTYK